MPEKRLSENQAGDPGQLPSASTRKLSLVTLGAKSQALRTSLRSLPCRRPLYQLLVLPGVPRQPALPPIFSPCRSRSSSSKRTPCSSGRTLSDQAPSTLSPRCTRAMAISSAGICRGSISARGSGASLVLAASGSGAGSRTCCRSMRIGTPSASASNTRPAASSLSSCKAQP